MTYTERTKIRNVEDVKSFFHHIVYERNITFHPDDRFEEYFNLETDEPSFTPEECEIYDHLMDLCFDVCEAAGADIYDLCMKALVPDDFDL